MSKILIANLKMNPITEKQMIVLVKAIDERGVSIAPPFVFLSAAKKVIRYSSLCAQDIFWENPKNGGAYTGEISGAMLKNLGVSSVLVGHSERRYVIGETDEVINKKIITILKAGLDAIVCVGERIEIRKRGILAAEKFVYSQLEKDFLTVSSKKGNRIIIAYEPIWAIGTGRNARPKDAAFMAARIKKFLKEKMNMSDVKVLYGGSVNDSNIKQFSLLDEIDGFLVGGASLRPVEFKKIIKTV